MDDPVPLPKPILSNMLGHELTNDDYAHYWENFPHYKTNARFQGEYQTFTRANKLTTIPSVQAYQREQNQAFLGDRGNQGYQGSGKSGGRFNMFGGSRA